MKYYINDPISETEEMYAEVSCDEFTDEFYHLPEEVPAFIGLIDKKEDNIRFSYKDYDIYSVKREDSNGNVLFQSDLSYDECVEYIKVQFERTLPD